MSQQDAHLRHLALRTWAGIFAIGFGSGLARTAPGTMGTALAVPLAVPLLMLPEPVFWLVWAALFGLGVYWCGVTSERLGVADPGSIVWDEMVALWLTLAFIPMHWAWWLAAFVLFRGFDIVKPWPIGLLDRRIKGGLGIMIDDIVAAGYALLILLTVRALAPMISAAAETWR